MDSGVLAALILGVSAQWAAVVLAWVHKGTDLAKVSSTSFVGSVPGELLSPPKP